MLGDMRASMTTLAAAAVAAMLGAGRAAAATAVVPATLHDVHGAVVDVAALASRERLVFVTVKATWCPVCRVQLQRLGRLLPHLRACGATFVVLVPGATDAVAAIARETSFPYPFVAENAEALAATAGLAGDGGELVPGFFVVDATRAVVWEQRGRGAGAFGDGELMAHLGCKGPSAPDLLASAR
jgi:peroxiredoxin